MTVELVTKAPEQRGATEKHADTPAVIARVWRGKDGRRRLVVSAADSYDLNKKPLTFTWVVLRGDEKQIQITPRKKDGSEVEIVVPYHPRRPVMPDAYVDTATVHDQKRDALACHASQKEWLDATQGMDSYLVAMDEFSSIPPCRSWPPKPASGNIAPRRKSIWPLSAPGRRALPRPCMLRPKACPL